MCTSRNMYYIIHAERNLWQRQRRPCSAKTTRAHRLHKMSLLTPFPQPSGALCSGYPFGGQRRILQRTFTDVCVRVHHCDATRSLSLTAYFQAVMRTYNLDASAVTCLLIICSTGIMCLTSWTAANNLFSDQPSAYTDAKGASADICANMCVRVSRYPGTTTTERMCT